MSTREFEEALESSLEATFDQGSNAQARPEPDPATTFESRSWSEDPEGRFAEVLARTQAAENDTRVAADSWLDRELDRIKETGFCCGEGVHFDAAGVLSLMLELNIADIEKAWKVWHERTFDAKSIVPESDHGALGDDRGQPSDLEQRAAASRRNLRERISTVTDVAQRKQKYLVKREPHRGRVADHPRIDAILERL